MTPDRVNVTIASNLFGSLLTVTGVGRAIYDVVMSVTHRRRVFPHILPGLLLAALGLIIGIAGALCIK
jgi:hypothetical protein